MKGIQKLLALAAISCLSSTVNAGWEENWLVGVSGGYEFRSGEFDIYTADIPAAIVLANENPNFDDNGFIWGFLGGYQARCNGWLFGIELNVDWHDHDSEHAFAFTDAVGLAFSGSAHYHRETNVGLTGRFGHVFFQNILGYIRLGAETSEDEIHISMLDPITPNNIVGHDDRRQYRFVGGLGLEMPIFFDNLTVRAEYNYHSKGKNVEVVAVGTDTTTLLVVDAHPHTHSLRASLVWNFL